MKIATALQLGLSFLLAAAVAGAAEEFAPGQSVWSKHVETNLLAEPGPLAAPASTVGFAEKLTIVEARGAWLRVRATGSKSTGEGWVFQGNVAAAKPGLPPTSSLTTVQASPTDTVAAARPLAPAAQDYANRHGVAAAEEDLDWIDAQAAPVTAQVLLDFMSANAKGEYQP